MKIYQHMDLLLRCLRIALPAFLAIGLNGCNVNNFNDLEPSGPLARSIDELFWITIALMSTILLPVFAMTACFIWKYRASNTNATYAPEWDSSNQLEWLVWLFPSVIVLILAIMTWIYTHRLDPYQTQESAAPIMEIQVIAMDWKWLFIYPEQNIAVVNELVIPINRPIAFKITSNTVMNAFFIPRLGGQIYAMAGMETQLHLIADKPGRYLGENIQYSGLGFSDQNFQTIAGTQQDFDNWVKKAKESQEILDIMQFREIVKPSIKAPVTFYHAVRPGLFKHVINSFTNTAMNNMADEQILEMPPSPNNSLRDTQDVR